MAFKSLAKIIGQPNPGYIFLGAPEAEAEALPTSKMPLSSVYKDHHNLIASLQNEKFIVCGRKGAGKSAFAEYVLSLAENDPNIFCKFIRQGEVNLENIIQLGKEAGHSIERENLYTWLIFTNILKLFSDNQAINNNDEYKLLSQFLKKNSGYIDIRESEIKELIIKDGFEVSIEYLKRFFTSKLQKNIEIKQTKAPFYKLIPHLKEVILSALKSKNEIDNANSYILFFDDLDISFNSCDKESIHSIISLLRVSKEINNEFFAKNNLESKVVILLRDDISRLISTHSSDTAKIFSSYSTKINWYQDEYHKSNPETDLHIREFINTRIQHALESQDAEFSAKDPWCELVEDPFRTSNHGEQPTKTSFKYILDHTFFRPRDLILFFKPLQSHTYKTPIEKSDINHLIGRYCEEVINELKNELSCFYSPTQIYNIFSALGSMSALCKSSVNNSIEYKQAMAVVEENCNEVVANDLLSDLFERSIIGNMGSNGYVFFKHREPSADTYSFSIKNRVVLHNAIKVYCSNKGYA
ncbi:P-loop ATPase, Sll1717 family [Chitinibacteraceae bacterium HSL-7]